MLQKSWNNQNLLWFSSKHHGNKIRVNLLCYMQELLDMCFLKTPIELISCASDVPKISLNYPKEKSSMDSGRASPPESSNT